MTTIVYRKYKDKVVVAADSQLTWGNIKLKCSKLTTLPDGSILGLAGSGRLASKIEEWWKNDREGECPVKSGKVEGEEGEDEASCQGLLISNEGDCYVLIQGVDPLEIKDEFGAIGSGSDMARVAMDRGDDPVAAIKQASKFDIYTNDQVEVVEIILEEDNE